MMKFIHRFLTEVGKCAIAAAFLVALGMFLKIVSSIFMFGWDLI